MAGRRVCSRGKVVEILRSGWHMRCRVPARGYLQKHTTRGELEPVVRLAVGLGVVVLDLQNAVFYRVQEAVVLIRSQLPVEALRRCGSPLAVRF